MHKLRYGLFLFIFGLIMFTGSNTVNSDTTLSTNLKFGIESMDVQALQIFLNTHGFPVSEEGLGSYGNETTYFGNATRNAVMSFQDAYKNEVLIPAGLTAPSGYVGSITRDVIRMITNDEDSVASLENTNLSAATITSVNKAPIANAGTNKTGAINTKINFSGTASIDPDGTIKKYTWNFGDGSKTETGKAVTHKYKKAGIYSVSLKVTDNNGAIGNTTISVNIGNVPVNAGGAPVSDTPAGSPLLTGNIQGKFVGSDLTPTTRPSGVIWTVDNNPTRSMDDNLFILLSPGNHNVKFLDKDGYIETYATCSYTMGSTECFLPSVSSYTNTNMTCVGGECVVPVNVNTASVTKIVVRYVIGTTNTFRFTLSKTGAKGTNRVSNIMGFECPEDCTSSYYDLSKGFNTTLSMQAIPEAGARFVNWSGDVPTEYNGLPTCGTDAYNCIVTPDGTNKNIIANFAPVNAPVVVTDLQKFTVTKTGSGTGGVSIINVSDVLNCDINCTTKSVELRKAFVYPLAFRAEPALGSRFVSWSGDVPTEYNGLPTCGTDVDCMITPNGTNRNIVANFASNTSNANAIFLPASDTSPRNRLSVAKLGNGKGTVESASVNGIICGPQCTNINYDINAAFTFPIAFRATPDANSRFVRWTDACTGTDEYGCIISINSNKAFKAEFESTSAVEPDPVPTIPATSGATIWSVFSGSTGHDYGVAVANDGNGNTILGGEKNYYSFIEKRNPQGTVMWTAESDGVGRVMAIATDSSGNIYSTGSSFQLGARGTFVTKHSSGGALLWKKRYIGVAPPPPFGKQDEGGTSIVLDKNGNVYIGGVSADGVDFGGGPISGGRGYVLKLDLEGNYIQARTLGGASVSALALDGGGNVFVTGRFGQSLDFGNGLITANGLDTFIAKYSDSNQLLWVKNYGSKTPHPGAINGISSNSSGLAISIDQQNNPILVGTYKFKISLGGGICNITDQSGCLPSDGFNWDYENIFLAKYDGQTGAHIWSKPFGSSNSDIPTSLVIDSNNNITLAGWNVAPIDFGGGLISVPSGINAFLAKFDTNGNHKWSKSYKVNNGSMDKVSIDTSGNIYAIGRFSGTTDFGAGNVTSTGGSDAFLLKLAPIN